MNRLFHIAVAGLLYLLVSCNNSPSGIGGLSREKILSNSSRTEKNGWIYIHLEGAPEVIGYQHGYLLANEILDLRGAMSMMNEKTTGRNWDFYRNESERLFWSKTPGEYQREIDGIVAGVNAKLGAGRIDRKDVVAINSFTEMPGYYVPWLESQNAPVPQGHCSAIAATGSWTRDGEIVIAHNSWTSYVIGERWNIIIDLVPEKGDRIIMDALPGLIHSGDDFYINSSGLIVTETTITQFKGFDTTGIPEFIRAREAIQYSSSLDEWAAIMKNRNNGGYANDWLIGDNKTGEIARLELGLKNQILERTKDGYFVGSNFAVNEKLIKEETTFDPSLPNISPNTRKARWDELMKESKGKIDVESAKQFMGDHYDTWRKKEKASGFTLCGHFDTDEIAAPYWGQNSFDPSGAVQGKATDSGLASEMKLWAIMGHPCGEPFNSKEFLEAHPEYSYQKDFLRDMPGEKWTLFGKITR